MNPLWRWKRKLDAALITYEECTASSSSCLSPQTRELYLKRVEQADYKELVEALGFDPKKISFDDFSEAWHTAWVLVGDQAVSKMMSDFAVDYIDVQHELELAELAGSAVFEIVLNALLIAGTAGTAAGTAGVGTGAALASKARYEKSLAKVGEKLKELASLLN